MESLCDFISTYLLMDLEFLGAAVWAVKVGLGSDWFRVVRMIY